MKGKKPVSTINLILILQLIIMVVIFFLIAFTVNRSTRQNSLDHMSTITDERAHIIDSYVENAEKTLIYYSKAGQIKELLLHPNDKAAVDVAQKYTEDFSDDIENLEGIYVSEWNTHVLAHTNPDVVGMIARPVKDGDDSRLRELQDAMKAAGDGVYNAGIIISSASGKQIVSMYKAVYGDDGQPVGFVGLDVFIDALTETLDKMSIRGINNSFYSMVNAVDNKYIFNVDKSKISTVTDNDTLLELCSKYKGSTEDDTGNFEYKANGEKYVSAYTYMADHGWLLMIDDTRSEVFSLTRNMRVYLTVFGLSVLGLMLLFHFINKKQQATAERLDSAVQKNAKTKESLNKAVFKDVLTDVNNRVAFSMDMDKKFISAEKPCYFAMFNISDFSSVNTKYGNDAGDAVLVSTVDILKKFFKKGSIYRTGSDEFVVAIPGDGMPDANNRMINNVNTALAALMKAHETPNGYVSVMYKTAMVRMVSSVDTSIITVLKDLTNRSNPTPDNVKFVDLG
ncbi:MAG TPA: GGDEF domain-containing protein [Ruminococcus sp.]|nr:GGDEF domain-containing protein [Ruminococcus sp.]